jgi:hypothetical protein
VAAALSDEGMNAVSIAPKSNKTKKMAVQFDLRDLPMSSLPGRVGRASRPVFKYELVAWGERDEPTAT